MRYEEVWVEGSDHALGSKMGVVDLADSYEQGVLGKEVTIEGGKANIKESTKDDHRPAGQ